MASSLLLKHIFLLFNVALIGANEPSLGFLVIGDFGGLPIFPYHTTVEAAVAKQMGKFADVNRVDYVLTVGDNFYSKGVKSVHDPRFKETYSKVFSQKSLDVNWYLLAGNHDHKGNVSAQIEYTRYLKRWQFPHYYYKQQFTVPNTQLTIDLLMLDTVLLCGISDDFTDEQPTRPLDAESARKQWIWLEENLRKSNADYLLVAGHYPVYSIAEHGPTISLVTILLPMLHKYKATAYLSGHEHNLQHLLSVKSGHTLNMIISGAANYVDDSTRHKASIPHGSSKFYWAKKSQLGGFGYMHATASNMTFTFFNGMGNQLYDTVMFPRQREVNNIDNSIN